MRENSHVVRITILLFSRWWLLTYGYHEYSSCGSIMTYKNYAHNTTLAVMMHFINKAIETVN